MANLIPVFRRGQWYESLDIAAVPGDARLRLSLAPQILIEADAKHHDGDLRKALPDRLSVSHRAMDLFESGSVHLEGVGTQNPQQFADAMQVITGLPPELTKTWLGQLRERVELIGPTPGSAAARTLVSLPSNTFTCVEAVFQAIVDSETTWIRPSRREPVSAARLVACLLEAGLPVSAVAFYPTLPSVLPRLIDLTDRQVVYGGDGMAGSFSHVPTLTLHGPGRGLAIVPADAEPVPTAAWLTALIADNGGRFCRNVCTIACEGDPALIAEALGNMLDAIRIAPVDDAFPLGNMVNPAAAAAIQDYVGDRLAVGATLTTSRKLFTEKPGQPAILAPGLVALADPGQPGAWHHLTACEMPFPFASIFATTPAVTAALKAQSLYVYTPVSSPASEAAAA